MRTGKGWSSGCTGFERIQLTACSAYRLRRQVAFHAALHASVCLKSNLRLLLQSICCECITPIFHFLMADVDDVSLLQLLCAFFRIGSFEVYAQLSSLDSVPPRGSPIPTL